MTSRRASAIGLLLALQFAGAPLLASAPSACCCAKKQGHCHCPACTHARETEAGCCRFIQPCAPSADLAVTNALPPTLPPHVAAVVLEVAVPMRAEPPAQQPPDPTVEVPTPPPLQG